MAGELPIRRRDWLSMVGAATAYACTSPAFAVAKLYGRVATYDFVSSGVVKGSQQTVCSPDGSLDVRFQFIDRGRGPALHSTISLDYAGFISKLRTTGYNYMKVTVDERFVARDGTAAWKNAAERETQSYSAPRFYISMDGSPEEGAIMVRAALRARSASLQLWPNGVTNVAAVKTLVASNGLTSKRVTMYEANGLDFTPVAIWLDDSGELFMSGDGWGAVVRSGWNAVLPDVYKRQPHS